MRKLIIAILFLISIAVSCRKELKKPVWDVDILAPLAHSNITIRDLLHDSIRQTGNDSLVRIVFSNSLYRYTFDTILELPDTSIQYTAKLDNLNISDLELSYRTSLGDIAQKDLEINGPGGLYDVIMNAHYTGQPAVIDPIAPQEFTNISMDASQYFQEIYVAEGTMELTIENNLPFDLSNIVIEMKNQSDNSVVAQDTFSLVQSGSSVTSSTDLGGIKVEGQMIGYVKIESPGSGVAVSIDTSDAITAFMRVKNLKIDSALAVFPDQDMITFKDEAVFKIKDAGLKSIRMKSGNLKIRVYNTLSESISYHYSIPGAVKNGIPFVLDGNIPASSGGSAVYSEIVTDLSGYNIDFKGIGPFEAIAGDLNGNGYIDSDTVNKLYYEIVGRIDSSGNLVHISLQDSIYITCDFNGLIPELIEGYPGSDTLLLSDSFDFEGLDFLNGNLLAFEEVGISLNVKSNAGISGKFNVTKLIAENTTNHLSEALILTAGINPFVVQSPDYTSPLLENINYRYSGITFNNANSNITDLFNLFPDKLYYDFSFSTAPPQSGDEGFLHYGSEVDASIDIDIPLSFIADEFILIDTAVFSVDEQDLENIQEATIYVIADNRFPIDLSIQVYLLDENRLIIDSLFNNKGFVNGGAPDAVTGIVEMPASSKLAVPFPLSRIGVLPLTKEALIKVEFNTVEGSYRKIYSYYNLSVSIAADFIYRNE